MKRTFSLLLCLILLCGILVPAVQAAEADPNPVEISCPNWNTEMDPEKLTYEIKTPGFSLFRQPVFVEFAEDGIRDETGLRDQTKRYQLAVGLNTELSEEELSETEFRLNGYPMQSVSVGERYLTPTMDGAPAVVYFAVRPYSELETLPMEVRNLEWNSPLSAATVMPKLAEENYEVRSAVYAGDTVEAPVMQPDDVFAPDGPYLFEFYIRGRELNERGFTERTVVSDAEPLEYLPDRTVYGLPGDPDAVRLYFRYGVQKQAYGIETAGEGCEVKVRNIETGELVSRAVPGTKLVTQITVLPGYQFESWQTEGFEMPEDQRTKAEAVFTMPANDVRLTAVTGQPDTPFTDVHPDDWFYDDVIRAVDQGWTTGVTPTTFVPYGTCTRAEGAAFLQRSQVRNPSVDGIENPFTDIQSDDWFYPSALWCFDQGIVKGKTETTFAPNDQITRDQFVLMLWRSYDSPKFDGAECPFVDVPVDSIYYDAVCWAYAVDVVHGVDAEHFNPSGLLTRAQVVAMLNRAY